MSELYRLNVYNCIYYWFFAIHADCDLYDGCNPFYCQHSMVRYVQCIPSKCCLTFSVLIWFYNNNDTHMTLFDRSFVPCFISHYMAWIIYVNISNVERVIFSYPTWIYQRSCSNDKTPCSISHVWIVYMNTSNVILLVDSDSTEEYSFQQWHIATSHCTRFNRRFHGIIHGACDFFLFDVNLSHRLLRGQWVICF